MSGPLVAPGSAALSDSSTHVEPGHAHPQRETRAPENVDDAADDARCPVRRRRSWTTARDAPVPSWFAVSPVPTPQHRCSTAVIDYAAR